MKILNSAGIVLIVSLLGGCVSDGGKKEVTVDQQNAVILASQSIVEGDPNRIPDDELKALNVTHLKAAAEDGNIYAQFVYGMAYARGIGTPKNYETAASWIHKSAKQGLDKAQHAMGLYRSEGVGGPLDLSKAAQWYRMAADQGVAKAQFNLGVMYFNGQGVTRNLTEAERWIRKAAEQGHAKSQAALASF